MLGGMDQLISYQHAVSPSSILSGTIRRSQKPTAFQLLFGKFYSLFSVKWVFLVALFIFEIGSLLCGVAPNSIVLMVGRGIAGLGSAGIFIGALVTIAHMVALEKRAALLGAIGGVYGVSSVVGPLVSFLRTSRL